MNKEEYKELVLKVGELIGENEEGLENLKKLQDSFNEVYDKTISSPETQSEVWKEKYDEILKRYHERFFSGDTDIDTHDVDVSIKPEEPTYEYDMIFKEIKDNAN